MMPSRLTAPIEGRRPTKLVTVLEPRTDEHVSDPMPITPKLAAIAAAVPPLDGEFRRIRACRGIKAGWIERRSQLLGLDIVGNVLDCRDLWHTFEDVSLQLRIEICVRITTWMRNRHPLAVGFGRLCRRSEEVPFADGEANDLDTPLKVLPLAGNLTATVFPISLEGLVGERSAKLVR